MIKNDIILVNEQDEEVGQGEKMSVHKAGILHRAFSVFVFNTEGKMMLQKRAMEKYHSPGLWSNTCCSHPRPGEKTLDAAHRRLLEEMGFDCGLSEKTSLTYMATLGELVEHEFDHIIFGRYDDDPKINKDEVCDWKWIGIDEVKQDVLANPGFYTYWFKAALNEI